MVEMRNFSMGIKLDIPWDQARPKVIEALGKEGFGVLTEIDVAATLKKKLDVDFRPYLILGACNPALAHKALSAVDHMGVLLPCNVILYADDAKSCTVAAIDPWAQFAKVDAPGLEPVATEVRARLVRVLEDLERG
jgi:uncharacterized protein (DUF302 family)